MACAFTLASLGGLGLVQRFVPKETRKQHNDVAGFIYAVLGVAYAVLLGLMVVAVWEDWEDARITADQEANELAEIFFLGHALPQPEGRRIQQQALSYARVVVEEEWPLMARGRSSPEAWATLDDLRSSIQGLEPQNGAQQALYTQGLDLVHQLADARRERLLYAEEGLPAILWVVLLAGGVVVVGFTYLFGLESNVPHVLMVAALALVISLVIFTVAALDFPFRGDVSVGPVAFEQVLERFESSRLSDL